MSNPLGDTQKKTCALCDEENNLKLCGRCGQVSYCGTKHQKKDWKEHKKICRMPNENCGGNSEANAVESNVEDTRPLIDMEQVLTDIGDLSVRAENPEYMPQWVAQNSLSLNTLDKFSERDRGIVAMISKNLTQHGICVIDRFTDEESANLCLQDATMLHSKPNHFKPGEVINQGERRERIRSDEIVWLDGSEEDAQSINHICKKIDTIIKRCNSQIGNYRISQRTKAMLACYPGNGTSYKCHIDNPSGDGRCITAIYYMNKGWDSKVMGGVLHLYPKGAKTKVATVEPIFNRLLLFYSDRRNPHEVLPAYAKRFAVTIWYFDEEERAKALATWAKNLPRKENSVSV